MIAPRADGSIAGRRNPAAGSSPVPDIPSGSEDYPQRLGIAQQRIIELQDALLLAQETIHRLESEVAMAASATRQRDDSEDQSSSSEAGVRIRNIATLSHWASFQQRDNWLRDLQRKFEASPKKFRNEKKRILIALDYTDPECRARWDRYLEEQPEDLRRQYQQDWEHFKK